MSMYTSQQFSKFTNSRNNGGAVEYYSDNVTLGVAPNQVVNDVFGNFITLYIRETGTRLLCIMDSQKSEYHDKERTDLKKYVFVPSPMMARKYPQYANVSVHISLRDD